MRYMPKLFCRSEDFSKIDVGEIPTFFRKKIFTDELIPTDVGKIIFKCEKIFYCVVSTEKYGLIKVYIIP